MTDVAARSDLPPEDSSCASACTGEPPSTSGRSPPADAPRSPRSATRSTKPRASKPAPRADAHSPPRTSSNASSPTTPPRSASTPTASPTRSSATSSPRPTRPGATRPPSQSATSQRSPPRRAAGTRGEGTGLLLSGGRDRRRALLQTTALDDKRQSRRVLTRPEGPLPARAALGTGPLVWWTTFNPSSRARALVVVACLARAALGA